MAKVMQAAANLRMDLFAPGMSLLHRAGLGGLACTLRAIEREFEGERLAAAKLPAPFKDGQPPWEIEDQAVTLRFGKPENAGDYLKKLFSFAFGIRKDGLIILPGQHGSEPGTSLLADLQMGLTLTFLQHGKVRKLAKELSTVSYDPEGEGISGVVVEYRQCAGFKHQKGYGDLVDSRRRIVTGTVRVDGPIFPGAVVRHVAFTGDTAAEDPPERMLPLYFALIGCLALPINRGVAALVVPDVDNLRDFIYDRPLMTPTTSRDCLVAGGADAGLRAQLRIRQHRTGDAYVRSKARSTVARSNVPGFAVMTFMPTPWASQQKSRVATLHVSSSNDRILDRFERALAYLPPRIAIRTIRESTGTGRRKTVVEKPEEFRSDSIVRPLIAENLARNRPWYADFIKLMTKTNPATGKPYRNQLIFERKGLHDMTSDQSMWDHPGEPLVVQAVHEAIRQSLGRIREETDGRNAEGLSQATKNRWRRFREKLRLDLAGAKTEAHVRFALMDLFTRGGSNSVLQQAWQQVLPIIRQDWHLARDLGLLALASYTGKGDADDSNDSEIKQK